MQNELASHSQSSLVDEAGFPLENFKEITERSVVIKRVVYGFEDPIAMISFNVQRFADGSWYGVLIVSQLKIKDSTAIVKDASMTSSTLGSGESATEIEEMATATLDRVEYELITKFGEDLEL